MLTEIQIRLRAPESVHPSVHWGSKLHGVLMRALPGAIATELHTKSSRSYASFVLPQGERGLCWRISIWDDELAAVMSQTLITLSEAKIEGYATLSVGQVRRRAIPWQDYTAPFAEEAEAPAKVDVEFITPTTHKSMGQYLLFPTVEHIYQNLAQRMPAFPGYDQPDGEVLQRLCAQTHITRYALRTAPYPLENIKITGYMGSLGLSLHGDAEYRRRGAMLLGFAAYAGVGIKTALGMGACRVGFGE